MTPTAYVLITAMPPTVGHTRLIQFASNLADRVEVIFCSQPEEPYTRERYVSLLDARDRLRLYNVHFNRVHKQLPQEPEGQEGFWDMWTEFLTMFGFQPGDYIVASERYGAKLAEYNGGVFWPFDVNRELNSSKATHVRSNPFQNWDDILPEFQKYLRKTVTIFGAESTGKTTLARALHNLSGQYREFPSHKVEWIFEYARPYLEEVKNEITVETMTAIWEGQRALQDFAAETVTAPFLVQDTDLFSTVGYWEMSPWAVSGHDKVPEGLVEDAYKRMSDLYIVLKSNIPYEADPLRYGGDHREIDDGSWIELCERYGLNYTVIDTSNLVSRLDRAEQVMIQLFNDTADVLSNYTREGKEYR